MREVIGNRLGASVTGCILVTGRSLRKKYFSVFNRRHRGDYDRGICASSEKLKVGHSVARAAQCKNKKMGENYPVCNDSNIRLSNSYCCSRFRKRKMSTFICWNSMISQAIIKRMENEGA